jgi:hypothetical protein
MRPYRSSLVWIPMLLLAVALTGCGGGGSSSGPPPSPTVTTTPATGIGTDNAALNGTVNPNAQATNAWLEWGTDSTLVSSTATDNQAIGAGTTAQTVSATITGLTSGTPYYYRVAATNASGTQKGAIASFTTAVPNSPPTVTTSAADNVTTTGATLHGTVLPNELDTTGWFEWGTDANLASFTSTPSQSLGSGKTSVAITANLALSAGTTYYFRAAASNSVGTSKGSILTFNTVEQLPTVTTQAATSITINGATLNANVNPNGLATTAFFEYGTDNTMSVITATTSKSMGSGTSGQSISDNIVSLSAGTRYYFRVSATNSGGTSLGSIVFFDTWKFFDDFSTDTTAGYPFTRVFGTLGTFTYDSVGQRIQVTTGSSNGLSFTHSLPQGNDGVFSLDFSPTQAVWPTHGGFWIRLKQDALNYYEVSNFSYNDNSEIPPPDQAAVRKYVAGALVQEVLYTMGYTQGNTYNIKITFSPTKTTMEAFGQTIDLTTNGTAISVSSFEVLTGQQDAYYDNIKLEAHP